MVGVKTILVGLGPHAKRIYMNCFQQNSIEPTIIVDLKSNEKEVLDYIKEKKLSSIPYFVDDKFRDSEELFPWDAKELENLIIKNQITHAIISTEPKAHFAYIKFFLSHNIHILVDKPLTAPSNVITSCEQAQKISKQYDEICSLYDNAQKTKRTILQVQCQRRWHKGYIFIHKLAMDMVLKYRIPITAIQMTHCDGMWNMPDEFLERENHPYKYGYGKLFHSGYHFVDLVSWFEEINNLLEEKKPNHIQMYSTAVRPSDFMQMINEEDYHRLLKSNKFDALFQNMDSNMFSDYGELDLYSVFQFKKEDKVTSTVTMNLMQNGFSRRSWDTLPEDTYKGNGRVRHEYMNIEIGPLMNIQVHSYQSKEIKDRCKGKTGVGEVEHFDIFVFRNVDIIGGVPMEKYTLSDLHQENMQGMGYNEGARQTCFKEFLEERVTGDPIHEYALGIHILEKEYEALSIQSNGGIPFVDFQVPEIYHPKCEGEHKADGLAFVNIV